MKSVKKTLCTISGLLIIIFCVTSAAQALTVRIDMSDAVQRLANSGYSIEDQISLVGTLYEAIVYDTSNQRAAVSIDSNTGVVTFVKSLPATRISWSDAATILENRGYTVTKLENKGDHYRADVFDSQNRAADLEVDKVTGNVIQHVLN